MITYTLVVMISAGYDFQKSPTSLSSFTVNGFTTHQACMNAGNEVLSNRLKSYQWNEIITRTLCVASEV